MAPWQADRLVCVLLLSLISAAQANYTTESPAEGSLSEFCSHEAFTARCDAQDGGEGGVIVLEQARYGRMALGRCITQDFGYMGCSVDVLPFMDMLCSGRPFCQPNYVTVIFSHVHPCPRELKAYLQASYSCMKASKKLLEDGGCRVDVSEPGTLLNHVTDAESCGTRNRPWVLQGSGTQKIILNFMDFGTYKGNQSSEKCLEYGIIREPSAGSQRVVCGGKRRSGHLHTSRSNRLELSLARPETLRGAHFFVTFEAYGCPEPVLPRATWVRRSHDHVTVGCYTSRDSWRLDCLNNTWQGEVGNCTQDVVGPSPAAALESVVAESVSRQAESSFSLELAVILAVGVGACMSVMLLAVGILYDSSKRNVKPHTRIRVVTRAATLPRQQKRPTPQPRTRKQTSNSTTARPKNNAVAGVHVTVPLRHKPAVSARHQSCLSGRSSGTSELLDHPYERPMSDDYNRISEIYDVPQYFDLDPEYMEQERMRALQQSSSGADESTCYYSKPSKATPQQ